MRILGGCILVNYCKEEDSRRIRECTRDQKSYLGWGVERDAHISKDSDVLSMGCIWALRFGRKQKASSALKKSQSL